MFRRAPLSPPFTTIFASCTGSVRFLTLIVPSTRMLPRVSAAVCIADAKDAGSDALMPLPLAPSFV